MVTIRNVLISTYGRALEKLNVARRHLPHDSLVLVCDSGDSDLPVIRRNVEERGGVFRQVEVDPFDFEECLEACYQTLRRHAPKRVVVNISCGPKTLVGAMLFAAFHAGVEVYHCDVGRGKGEDLVIRVPTLKGFELRRRFRMREWKIVASLREGKRKSEVQEAAGLRDDRVESALYRLEREGILVQELRDGEAWVIPTAVGRFFRRFAPAELGRDAG